MSTATPSAAPGRFYRAGAPVLLIAMALLASRPGAAQEFPRDPVETFRQALKQEESRRFGFQEEGKALDFAILSALDDHIEITRRD